MQTSAHSGVPGVMPSPSHATTPPRGLQPGDLPAGTPVLAFLHQAAPHLRAPHPCHPLKRAHSHACPHPALGPTRQPLPLPHSTSAHLGKLGSEENKDLTSELISLPHTNYHPPVH